MRFTGESPTYHSAVSFDPRANRMDQESNGVIGDTGGGGGGSSRRAGESVGRLARTQADCRETRMRLTGHTLHAVVEGAASVFELLDYARQRVVRLRLAFESQLTRRSFGHAERVVVGGGDQLLSLGHTGSRNLNI